MYLGFDIGGTKIKAVLVKDRKIIQSKSEKLPGDLERLMTLIGEIAMEFTNDLKKEKIGGVGFAIAGALDIERESMLKSPNIPYLDNQPLKKLFTQCLVSYQVKIEHDAHCFLLAESKVGLAQELNHVFYLAVGTGVGGAFMIDRRIYRGAHGSAGEVGHSIIDLSAGLDLEDLSGNNFFKKELGISADEAEKLMRANDKNAAKVFQNRCYNLGVGLANIINVLDLEAIILGGGIVSAKDLVLPKIKEAIERYVISPAAKETPILFSKLEKEGGALGAALLFDET